MYSCVSACVCASCALLCFVLFSLSVCVAIVVLFKSVLLACWLACLFIFSKEKERRVVGLDEWGGYRRRREELGL